MTTGAQTAELRFDPPGPGSWTLDPVHFPRPMTRYWSEFQPEAMMRGFREFTRYYGMLIDALEYQYVNGFAYSSVRPISEKEIPARLQRAAEVFEGRLWREQLRDWNEQFKPQSIKRHLELQSVNPDELSDEDLVTYLTRCRDHHAEMYYQHMRHTGAAMVPVGDLLVHAIEWAGVPPAELLGMTRGAAPVSAGASAELERVIAAFKADPAARELLESDRDPGEILSELRKLDGEAGEAISDYLDLTGYRLLDGFDISDRYALELPDALVRAIRAAVSGDSPETSQDEVAAKIDEVRSKIPEEHRQEFDELLFDARLMYRLRDERGVFSDIWASGIMRRAVIAGGRRLAKRGRIQDPEHFVDAGFEEMVALLSGTNGPSAEELAARFSWRTSHSAKDAPATLGPPAPPPPDPSNLPPAGARMMAAIGFGLESLFAPSAVPHEEDVLHGLAASGGIYEGPARRVSGPSEFERIIQGDVLVTEATSEAFNILLPLLGALVTDTGGLLSHPAIVAREYGIPGVVGTRDATERIADGTQVRVNGDSGEVTVLT